MKYDINLKIGSKCINVFVLVLTLFKLFKLYIFISIIPYWVVIKSKQTKCCKYENISFKMKSTLIVLCCNVCFSRAKSYIKLSTHCQFNILLICYLLIDIPMLTVGVPYVQEKYFFNWLSLSKYTLSNVIINFLINFWYNESSFSFSIV